MGDFMNTEDKNIVSNGTEGVTQTPVTPEVPSFNIGGQEVSAPTAPAVEATPVVESAPAQEVPSFNIGGQEVSAPVAAQTVEATPVVETPAIESSPAQEVPSFNIGGQEVSAPVTPTVEATPAVDATPVVESTPVVEATPVVETVQTDMGSKEVPVTVVPTQVEGFVPEVNNVIPEAHATSDVITEAAVDVTAEISDQENIPELTPEMVNEAVTPETPIDVTPEETPAAPEEVVLEEVIPDGVGTINPDLLSEAAPVLPNSPVPNAPEEIAIDPNNQVIDTDKKESKGSIGIFVIVGLLFVVLMFSDTIMGFFDNPSSFINGGNDLSANESSNLVDGFILIDSDGYIKVSNVKFYNFKKAGNNELLINYVSYENIKDVKALKIYVEIYDSAKDLIHKQVFNTNSNKLDIDALSPYSMKVTSDVYEAAYYSKVAVYTDEMINKKDTLVCSYPVENTDTFKLTFTNTFNFVNDTLVSYDIVRKYDTSEENDLVEVYKNQIKTEYLDINRYNVKTEYADNKLIYSINLTKLPAGFIPMYPSTSTKKTIKNKETLKKWECK